MLLKKIFWFWWRRTKSDSEFLSYNLMLNSGKKNSAIKKMNILTLELSGKKILNFQQIGNWIRWTISQRKTITYFVRNSGCENKETLSSQYNRNRTPYSTPAISTSYSPLQNDLLLDEELVWIDHSFNSKHQRAITKSLQITTVLSFKQ